MPEPHLSDRELDVLRLLASGKSNAEIGGELFIGVETVKSHLSTIYRRLGVSRRGEAAAWINARRELLVDPDAPIAHVSVEQKGAVVEVRLVGEFDITTADLVTDALDEAQRCDAKRIELDMGEVDFIDSSALRALVQFFSNEARPGARVVNASNSVRRVVEFTGVGPLFGMAD